MFRIRGTIGKFIPAAGFVSAMLVPPDSALAGKVHALYAFRGGSDGFFPCAGLIADAAGNFYGTTEEGGGAQEDGTVFKLASDGTETILHSFAGSDGEDPVAGVTADSAGDLYGTTISGGTDGYGVVFEVATDGAETVLHSFKGGKDGMVPYAGLLLNGGNFYGTTFYGGGNYRCTAQLSCGTVFKLTPDGTMTVIHAFSGGNDGGNPWAGLIADAAGDLYGTTTAGGTGDCSSGCGTIFEITSGGKEKVLHSFLNGNDGFEPEGVLTEDAKGNFYGTTVEGGSSSAGTIFKLAADGNETVLYSFTGGSDGAYPDSALIMDSAGNLYGTTPQGGDIGYGYGTIFRLSPGGKLKVLHAFCYDCKTGREPAGGVIADQEGNLYSTATVAGRYNAGTVFELLK
jgi:uncharacterized repeat protein (TIGR03803 family)